MGEDRLSKETSYLRFGLLLQRFNLSLQQTRNWETQFVNARVEWSYCSLWNDAAILQLCSSNFGDWNRPSWRLVVNQSASIRWALQYWDWDKQLPVEHPANSNMPRAGIRRLHIHEQAFLDISVPRRSQSPSSLEKGSVPSNSELVKHFSSKRAHNHMIDVRNSHHARSIFCYGLWLALIILIPSEGTSSISISGITMGDDTLKLFLFLVIASYCTSRSSCLNRSFSSLISESAMDWKSRCTSSLLCLISSAADLRSMSLSISTSRVNDSSTPLVR